MRLLQVSETKVFPLSLSLKNSKKPKTWFGTRWSATWVGHVERVFSAFWERERGIAENSLGLADYLLSISNLQRGLGNWPAVQRANLADLLFPEPRT